MVELGSENEEGTDAVQRAVEHVGPLEPNGVADQILGSGKSIEKHEVGCGREAVGGVFQKL